MRKIIAVLFALFVCGGVFAQNAEMKFVKPQDYCKGARSKINIQGGLFDGKYISCEKGREQACMEIAQDLEDLFQKAGAGKYWNAEKRFLYLPHAPFEPQSKVDALEQALSAAQAQKLAGIKAKQQYPFFYAVGIKAGEGNMAVQSNKTVCEEEEGGDYGYFFWLVNTDNDKNLKKGKPADQSAKSEYMVAVYDAMIYVQSDK
ncbi:MAG: hypothetical protein LBI01_07140 [Elusimicrobium sp.]|jgi:hypothetical protein|nr:hypothetical protein [Elusimicrobium sp.]